MDQRLEKVEGTEIEMHMDQFLILEWKRLKKEQ